MLDYINYLLHCPVRIPVWFSVCCEPLLVMSLTVTTDRICHAGLSAVRSLDSVPFPSPLPMQAELASGEAECENSPWCCAHDLGSVLTQLKTPTRAPQSITALLLAVLEKGLECFLHNAAVWLNQSKLPMFLQACSRQEVFTHLFISMVSCQSKNLTPNFALLIYKCSHFSYRAIKPLWGWVTWLNLY